MAAVFAVSLALQVGPTVLAIQAIALIGAAAFVLSRPSRPKHKHPDQKTKKGRRDEPRDDLK